MTCCDELVTPPMDAAPPSSQQSSTSSASAAASTEEASFESCAWKQDSVLSFVNSRNSIVATEVTVIDSCVELCT